ncbi:VanZ family protein [Winogradskyella endarachnes]|uniref:Trypsin n=1 Tax=Winogradskyella endarachnes TaxID=2681965 RepID=A0A6L6U4I0_9FLAO|nr:VanZ family protein [Winogradskyella endarachnes]MUU76858.1 trypsin [Winogradskyella endarachnes]
MKNWFKWVALIFLLFIVYIVYSANTGHNIIVFQFVNYLPFGDKMGHFFLFGFFSLVVNIALKFKPFKYFKSIPLGTCLVLICLILEELSQAYFPNRTLDFVDLIADSLGIAVFTLIGIYFNNKGCFTQNKAEDLL